jgi:nucleoside-diphosphate-sugar epimerase
MKKVLVVGGAGYVGCVLVEELLNKGYSVRIFDRLFFGQAPLEHLLDRVELVCEDMREIDASHAADCTAVINLGGLSNDPTAEFAPLANEELNTFAAIRVGEVAKRAGVERLLVASTCSIYDRGLGNDHLDVLLDEDARVNPQAAYASSKYNSEQELLRMSDDEFCVTAFRKGTIFGFSPRMRYDLVVNTFVKDALSRGSLFLQAGGEMWRPLIDVRDVARAYVMALEADPARISGQIFNLSAGNFRISELALRVQQALTEMGRKVSIEADYAYRTVRNYRVATDKVRQTLGFQAQIDIGESVRQMVQGIERWGYTDFSNPRYYNIGWMKLLEESVEIIRTHGYALSRPESLRLAPNVIDVTDETDETDDWSKDRVG